MPNNVMSRCALQLHGPNPLLVMYHDGCRARALVQRKYYQRLIDHSESIVETYSKMFPELERRISELQRLIGLRTQGAPMTEELDVSNSVNTESHQEAVAHAFLLKKAYRAAAKLAHPDKGGNDADFAAINAAYKARDLESLNEFVIAQHRTLLESIEHWLTEIEKPKVQWIEFQSTAAFKAVRYHKLGQAALAVNCIEQLLRGRILQLLNESTR